MTEPNLHGTHVDSGAQPTGCSGIAKAVQVPLGVVQGSPFCHVLAEVVQKRGASEPARFERRGEHEQAVLGVMFREECNDLLSQWHGALLPVLGQETVLWFSAHVQSPAGKVEIGPLEGLELPATECRCKCDGEENPLPLIACTKKPLQFALAICNWTFAESRQPGNFLDGVLDFQPVEKIVQDHPVGIERRSRVKTFGLAPSEELLDVLSRNLADIRLGRNKLSEDAEDMIVFLPGELFAESFDVGEKLGNRIGERKFGLRLINNLYACLFGLKFQALSALCL